MKIAVFDVRDLNIEAIQELEESVLYISKKETCARR